MLWQLVSVWTYVLVSCETNEPYEIPTITFQVPLLKLNDKHTNLVRTAHSVISWNIKEPFLTLMQRPIAVLLFAQCPCDIWAFHSSPVSSMH